MATDNKEFIVTIDLGSSTITALAAQKQPDGAVKVLAYHQEPSDTFVRKGRISNVDKMVMCVKNIKEKLEKHCKKTVAKAYVGVGGMGMHTVKNVITRNFSEKNAVSQDIVDSLFTENKQKFSGERNILETVPQEYKVGTQLTNDPVGCLADTIEANFCNIVANLQSFDQVRKCFTEAGIAVVDTPIAVLRMADLMLTEPEKRSGCVFIDMGAETTSVAVYKNNVLRHFAAIPLGGMNITRDIMSLQLEEEEAEQLKVKYGKAKLSDKSGSPIHVSDGRTFEYEEFGTIVEARVEEIVLNIKHQVELSGYDKHQLIGGIILTGGAANLKGMEVVVSELLGIEKLRVAKNARVVVRGERIDAMSTEIYATALALFEHAEVNCCGGELGDEPQDLFTEPTKPEQPTELFTEDPETVGPEPTEEEPTVQEEEEPTETPKKNGGLGKTLGRMWDTLRNLLDEE
ncbi:MAG: cell division protein FtsA [Bacteroidaceae bacterium]|nr:cell division protein FtsA [Bacteroidaceae bacterium]